MKTICKRKTWEKTEWKRKNKACLKNMKNQKIKYHGNGKHGRAECSHGEKEKSHVILRNQAELFRKNKIANGDKAQKKIPHKFNFL